MIEATAKLYGDIGFATRKRDFIEFVDCNTWVKIVLGNDYVCTELRCPFAEQCKNRDYQAVVSMLISRLPLGLTRDLVAQLNPEISDRWSIRRYGLKARKRYRLRDIVVVNDSQEINDL